MSNKKHSIQELTPEINSEIYKLLYIIEVSLREFIIGAMDARYGRKWSKSLPEDIKKKILDGKEYEKKTLWVSFISHQPLYYADFPDLIKIIEQGDKWRDVFSHSFGKNKEIFTSTLKELEPIRNKVAHNRKATEGDLSIVNSVMSKLESWLSRESLELLVSKSHEVIDLNAKFQQIRHYISDTATKMLQYEVVNSTAWWNNTLNEWWFDSEYIGVPLEAIVAFMEAAKAYESLNRTRGSGHVFESWMSNYDIPMLYRAADDALCKVMEATK